MTMIKPGCPNCASSRARLHCHPANQAPTNGRREPKLRAGISCPWRLCLDCDHLYDDRGRSMPRKAAA